MHSSHRSFSPLTPAGLEPGDLPAPRLGHGHRPRIRARRHVRLPLLRRAAAPRDRGLGAVRPVRRHLRRLQLVGARAAARHAPRRTHRVCQGATALISSTCWCRLTRPHPCTTIRRRTYEYWIQSYQQVCGVDTAGLGARAHFRDTRRYCCTSDSRSSASLSPTHPRLCSRIRSIPTPAPGAALQPRGRRSGAAGPARSLP